MEKINMEKENLINISKELHSIAHKFIDKLYEVVGLINTDIIDVKKLSNRPDTKSNILEGITDLLAHIDDTTHNLIEPLFAITIHGNTDEKMQHLSEAEKFKFFVFTINTSLKMIAERVLNDNADELPNTTVRALDRIIKTIH